MGCSFPPSGGKYDLTGDAKRPASTEGSNVSRASDGRRTLHRLAPRLRLGKAQPGTPSEEVCYNTVMSNGKPPREKRSALIQARVTLAEMEYLTQLAEGLDVTLSEAVRTAISRSIMRDVEKGELDPSNAHAAIPAWVARTARDVRASPVDEDPADWDDVPEMKSWPSVAEYEADQDSAPAAE